MRLRTFDELMVSIRSAAGDVPRLRVFVKQLEGRIDFVKPTVMRREGGSETLQFPVEADRIPVYLLLERDPIATFPDDPLSTLFRVGPMSNPALCVGLFPHAADPYWHGVRLLCLFHELLAERDADRRPIPKHEFALFRKGVLINASAHGRMEIYQRSRIALDILDAHFGGRIRTKAAELKSEGLLTGEHLRNRMRMYMDHLVNVEFIRPASEEETRARAMATGLAIPALLDGMPIDPYS
jgi:hypothetical protein